MKYSIVIPTLNEEVLLPGLLRVLSNSELKSKFNYEVIISDSGSTDNTVYLSKQYADKTLTFENNDKKNISFGRYKGAENSGGDVLIFINADVRFENFEYFMMKVHEFSGLKGYSAMTCKIKVFPELENLSDKLFSSFINFYVRTLNIIGIGMARGECQVIKRKIYNNAGGYNTTLSAGEDFELSTRLRKIGKIYFAHDITVYESPRRYHKWGYLKIVISWFGNSMSSWFLKKSVSKNWEEVR